MASNTRFAGQPRFVDMMIKNIQDVLKNKVLPEAHNVINKRIETIRAMGMQKLPEDVQQLYHVETYEELGNKFQSAYENRHEIGNINDIVNYLTNPIEETPVVVPLEEEETEKEGICMCSKCVLGDQTKKSVPLHEFVLSSETVSILKKLGIGEITNFMHTLNILVEYEECGAFIEFFHQLWIKTQNSLFIPRYVLNDSDTEDEYESSLLMDIIKSGHKMEPAVLYLLTLPDLITPEIVNFRNKRGDTPFTYACIYSSPIVVDAFLKYPFVNVNNLTVSNCSPLNQILRLNIHHCDEIAMKIIDKVEINSIDKKGNTALNCAIIRRSEHIAMQILERFIQHFEIVEKSNVNESVLKLSPLFNVNNEFDTSFKLACRYKLPQVINRYIEFFIQHKDKPYVLSFINKKGIDRTSGFDYLILNKMLEQANILLENDFLNWCVFIEIALNFENYDDFAVIYGAEQEKRRLFGKLNYHNTITFAICHYQEDIAVKLIDSKKIEDLYNNDSDNSDKYLINSMKLAVYFKMKKLFKRMIEIYPYGVTSSLMMRPDLLILMYQEDWIDVLCNFIRKINDVSLYFGIGEEITKSLLHVASCNKSNNKDKMSVLKIFIDLVTFEVIQQNRVMFEDCVKIISQRGKKDELTQLFNKKLIDFNNYEKELERKQFEETQNEIKKTLQELKMMSTSNSNSSSKSLKKAKKDAQRLKAQEIKAKALEAEIERKKAQEQREAERLRLEAEEAERLRIEAEQAKKLKIEAEKAEKIRLVKEKKRLYFEEKKRLRQEFRLRDIERQKQLELEKQQQQKQEIAKAVAVDVPVQVPVILEPTHVKPVKPVEVVIVKDEVDNQPIISLNPKAKTFTPKNKNKVFSIGFEKSVIDLLNIPKRKLFIKDDDLDIQEQADSIFRFLGIF